MKIKTPSNLPITINRFIEYKLYLSEFHPELISQTMRKLFKVFNQPCSSSRNRHIYADVYSEWVEILKTDTGVIFYFLLLIVSTGNMVYSF